MGQTADIVGESQTREVEQGKLWKGAAHVPPSGGEASLWVLGELLTRKVPSQRTGGAYSLFEVITQPGAGPPPHVQHREDEAFYVLEGEYEFFVDGHTLRAWAGSLVYVPKGTLHAHANVGKVPGRMLTTHTPGTCTSSSSRTRAGPRNSMMSSRPPSGCGRTRRSGYWRWRPSSASRYPRPSQTRPGARRQGKTARAAHQRVTANPDLSRAPAPRLAWRGREPSGLCQSVSLLGASGNSGQYVTPR